MHKHLSFILCVAVCTACQTQSGDVGSLELSCQSEAIASAVSAIENSDAKIVTIGEIHGTQEYPTAVACVLAAHPEKKWLLAYEFPAELNSTLVRRSDEELRKAIISSELQDGRSSEAAFRLLSYSLSRPNIDVLFFDRRADIPGKGNYVEFITYTDHLSAEMILEAMASKNYEKILVYGGNIRMARGGFNSIGPGGINLFEWLSAESGVTVESVNFVSSRSGTFWGCTESCGINEHRATALDPDFSSGFDQIAVVSQVTASLPIKHEN